MGCTVVNEDCTLVFTCVRDGGGAYYENVDLEPCGSNTLSYCLLVYVVLLWQVGSTVVNEDCTLVSTCVPDGRGAYFEHVDLEPCGSNKLSYCLLVFVVFLWQVGSTVVNEDCTLVSTCVRDGGGLY